MNGEKIRSPAYVSEKVTTPSLSPSKNAACFCSAVMPPAPESSPYADAWPPFPAGIKKRKNDRYQQSAQAATKWTAEQSQPYLLPKNMGNRSSRNKAAVAAAGEDDVRRGLASISRDVSSDSLAFDCCPLSSLCLCRGSRGVHRCLGLRRPYI